MKRAYWVGRVIEPMWGDYVYIVDFSLSLSSSLSSSLKGDLHVPKVTSSSPRS